MVVLFWRFAKRRAEDDDVRTCAVDVTSRGDSQMQKPSPPICFLHLPIQLLRRIPLTVQNYLTTFVAPLVLMSDTPPL